MTLPSQNQEWEAGLIATVSGWGTLTSGGDDAPDVLHSVDVPIVSDEGKKTKAVPTLSMSMTFY